MQKIVVTRRGSGFHACLDGHPEHWESGSTAYEAVGRLVSNHETTLGIEVELPAGERPYEFDCPLRS
ncbi:MAG: hypothetical protein HY471_00420 [Candidatus Sungbacteria bacterium]|nr:hypothetical protein [Candidatus Sungbacteria bacterium]